MSCSSGESDMKDGKAFDFGKEFEHMEVSDIEDRRRQKELATQGEELERIESQYGIWQSMMMNKRVLLYSTFPFPGYSKGTAYWNIVLVSYTTAAVYVCLLHS